MEFAGGDKPHETVKGPGSGPMFEIVINAVALNGPTVEQPEEEIVFVYVVAITPPHIWKPLTGLPPPRHQGNMQKIEPPYTSNNRRREFGVPQLKTRRREHGRKKARRHLRSFRRAARRWETRCQAKPKKEPGSGELWRPRRHRGATDTGRSEQERPAALCFRPNGIRHGSETKFIVAIPRQRFALGF
jgi:hypothetical protein